MRESFQTGKTCLMVQEHIGSKLKEGWDGKPGTSKPLTRKRQL